jgi:hypothetical protein
VGHDANALSQTYDSLDGRMVAQGTAISHPNPCPNHYVVTTEKIIAYDDIAVDQRALVQNAVPSNARGTAVGMKAIPQRDIIVDQAALPDFRIIEPAVGGIHSILSV